MKKLLTLLSTTSLLVSASAFAYYGENSKAAKYYRGEISADEYIDSLGVPSRNPPPTTIIHNNGTKTIIQPSSSGNGTIYHNDGSKSVYYSPK